MNKRTMKKGLAIVLALVMVFAMTATAFAADSDPNLTFANDAQARTEYQLSDITSTTKLHLQAAPASTRWSATTFDTESADQAVSWSSTNPFYSATYKADTYSTPAYALAAIKNPNGQYNIDEYAADYVTNFTIFASNTQTIPTTYINTITTDVLNGDTNVVENKTYAPIYSEAGYYGWYYRVVRDGSVVEESKVIGAADFKLNTNDTVYWLFGTETEVDNFMSAF